MRYLVIALLFAASPAIAQTAQQSVTLSPAEMQTIVNALAERDPVIALLLKKQHDAQAAAAEAAKAAPPAQPAAK